MSGFTSAAVLAKNIGCIVIVMISGTFATSAQTVSQQDRQRATELELEITTPYGDATFRYSEAEADESRTIQNGNAKSRGLAQSQEQFEERTRSWPPTWQTALAKIMETPNDYSPRLLQTIRTLSLEDIKIIDHIRPYVMGGVVFRDKSKVSRHPIPDLTLANLLHLEDIGIISQAEGGLERTATAAETKNKYSVFVGKENAVVVRFSDTQKLPKLPITRVTKLGVELLGLLPPELERSDLERERSYLQWLGTTLGQHGNRTEIWKVGPETTASKVHLINKVWSSDTRSQPTNQQKK